MKKPSAHRKLASRNHHRTQRLKIGFMVVATRTEFQDPDMPPWPAALPERALLPAGALVEVARRPAGTPAKIPDLAGYLSGARNLCEEEEPEGIRVLVVFLSAPSIGVELLPVRGDGQQVRSAVGLSVALWRQKGSPTTGDNLLEVLDEGENTDAKVSWPPVQP